MRRSRCREDQIVGVLRKHEAGVQTGDLCRMHGFSDATFHTWKSKCGEETVFDGPRLRQLEDENRRLKKLLAELMLDISVLKDLLEKTEPGSGALRCGADANGRLRLLRASHCTLIGVNRSA
uniref:transposase n=1 Tax=uncultured Sphingomonas sp. TaxID=158754 RepID=UPI0035CA7E3E